MKVIKLKEDGFEEAALGLSLSYRKLTDEEIQAVKQGNYGVTDRVKNVVMKNLALKGGGHNKFLESMQVWLLVQSNRAFFQQLDTYRVGISKQSESTMHSLAKFKPTKENFEPDTDIVLVTRFLDKWHEIKKDVDTLRRSLPQGWLECRQISTNYKTLQNIYWQRRDHRSKDWHEFLDQLLSQLDHPDFITQE